MTTPRYFCLHQLHLQLLAYFQAKPARENKCTGCMQKSIEDAAGQCRTLVFLTNDISTLETALQQCKMVIETLASSATTSLGIQTPPVFHTIAKPGVEQFKTNCKSLHRVGVKRKCKTRNQPPSKSSRSEATCTSASIVEEEVMLTQLVKHEHGHPRLKRLQRKQPALPRQVSSPNRKRVLEAAAILRRGMLHSIPLYLYSNIQMHFCITFTNRGKNVHITFHHHSYKTEAFCVQTSTGMPLIYNAHIK